MDWMEGVASALGAGVGTGLVSLAGLFIAKSAIEVAVRQAADRELKRLEAQLAADAERERQRFERDLEVLKAELNLAAEVRRQVAAQKVKFLMELTAAVGPLERDALNAMSREDAAKQLTALHVYFTDVHAHAHLFTIETANAFSDFGSQVHTLADKWRRNVDDAAPEKIGSLRRELMELIRRELGVTSSAAASKTRSAA